MTKIGIFKIDGSFKIHKRGLVVYGDIIEGQVKIDSYITFAIGTENITMKIAAVEFVDSISTREFKIGLMFSYNNEEEKQKLESLKLTEQTCEIMSEE